MLSTGQCWSSLSAALRTKTIFSYQHSGRTNVWMHTHTHTRTHEQPENIMLLAALHWQRHKIGTDSLNRKLFTHALSAPPPFACPSSLVIMTEATSTFSLKARACIQPSSASLLYCHQPMWRWLDTQEMCWPKCHLSSVQNHQFRPNF